MIQDTLKNARYVAAAGAVFAILFMGFSHTASATVTYYWSANGNRTIPYSNMWGFHIVPYTGPQVTRIHFDGTTFEGGWTSLSNVNFIDIRATSTTSNSEPHVSVVCTQLIDGTTGKCNQSTIIATSSTFTINDLPEDGWFRIYWPEAWNASVGSGEHLYFTFLPEDMSQSDTYFSFLGIDNVDNIDGFDANGIYFASGFWRPYSGEMDMRIGYDDLQDTTYYNGTLFVPSLVECSFGVFPSFDLSANDLLTYDNFWTEYTYTITYSDGQQTYGQTVELTNGSGGSVFDCTDEDTGAIVAVTSATLLGEIESTATIVDLMSLSTISGFKVGTTSLNLTDTLYAIDPFYIINPDDPFSENATSTNMEECRFGGNWARCFFGLIVPSTEQMQDSISRATSTIFVIPPLSWIISVGTILVQPLDSHATGTLPNFNITVPEGVPGAGAGVDLTPWNHLKTFWESEWNSNDIYEFESASSTGEIIEPKINEIAKYMFALWLFGLLLVIRL